MNAIAQGVDELQSKLEALGGIVADAAGRLDPDVVDRARQVHTTATERLGHGTSHTVAALAGATGSGKSSLFNAVSDTTFATTGVRRPTTSHPLAVVFGDGAEQLLDWLQVPARQRIDNEVVGSTDLGGLVLLDLPDHDSTQESNRAHVDRLVEVVDLFIWVVDPQKYADAALHEQYLRAFSGHGAVTIVVLNQVDRLTPQERTACVEDLTRLLVADGLRGVRVIPASALTGEGVDLLRRELSARVAERRALVRRIDADLDWVASDLAAAVGESSGRGVVGEIRTRLVDAATEAAGARQIEHAVDASYRHRAALAVGWPPVRWVRRAKSDPLSRLGIGTRAAAQNAASDEGLTVRRTAITADPVASGRLGEALREVSRSVTDKLPDAPRAAVEQRLEEAGQTLPDRLDEAAARTDLHVDPPRWWTVLGALQRLLALCLVAGVVWLLALFVIGWFQLPDPPLPKVWDIPLPSLLALGGAALGFFLALVGRRVAAIGAQRRAKQARRSLAVQVDRVVEAEVVKPIADEMVVLQQLGDRIRSFLR